MPLIKHEAWQIQMLEQTLAKVQEGNGKFTSHEAVTDWLKSWGTDNELSAPNTNQAIHTLK